MMNPEFWTPAHRRSLYTGLLLVVLAIVAQIGAGQYSARNVLASPPQGDLFLDALPYVDLGFMIVAGAIFFWISSFFLLALHPHRLLFGLKAIALFIISRAFFINLTREGIYPGAFVPTSGNTGFSLYHLVTFQGNFFFSGHTGFPFLMALIFWDNPFWRRLFLVATAVFGISVLLAHAHYSIDVFAAPFITYGIFAVGAKFFPEDFVLSGGVRV